MIGAVHKVFADMGCNYPIGAIAVALNRGWNPVEHETALLEMDELSITVSHPANFLNAEEAELFFP